MKLKIQNFAKIKDADIILDGITVIAGKNNTGKSTVEKIYKGKPGLYLPQGKRRFV